MHIRYILRSPDAEGNSGGGQGSNPFAPSSGSVDSAPPSTPTSTPDSSPAPSSQQVSTPSTAPTSQPATQATASTTATTPTQQPPIIGMSQEQLQQLLAAQRQASAPAPQKQEMSDEQFKQTFNIYEANERAFEETFGVKPTPAQLTSYNQHLQAVAKQAVTINRYLMDQKLSEIRNQIQPVQQTIEQQKAQQYFNEFTTEYPGLKDYGPLLKEITDAAQARGMRFNSVGEAKTFVAAQAAKLLGKQVNDFKVAGVPAAGNNNQTTPQQSGIRSMSTTSMGGRSGVSGGAAPSQSTAERLFSGQAT